MLWHLEMDSWSSKEMATLQLNDIKARVKLRPKGSKSTSRRELSLVSCLRAGEHITLP